MKILIPIYEREADEAILDCVESLKFPSPEIELINVVPPITSMDATYLTASAACNQEIMDTLQASGQAALNAAVAHAKACGMNPKTTLGMGYPASVISETATATNADLIALSAEPKGVLSRIIGGSVSQNLASAAPQSLLIARQNWRPCGKVSAVFATDHSEYADQCLQKLLSWNPGGFSRIEVLTAFKSTGHEALKTGNIQALSPEEVDCLLKRRLGEKTASIAAKFQLAGIPSTSKIIEGDVNEAIQSTMSSFEADLLILGAKGHSLWERALLGSTAMHQVVSERHSLLILRI